MSEKKPQQVVYAGIQLPEPEEGEMALAAVVLLKLIDAHGAIRYREFRSAELHPMEALGMATSFTDTCRSHLMRGARPR